jgi:TolA-binding protein
MAIVECDRRRELLRSPSADLGDDLRAHLASCAACAAEWEELSALGSIARSTPVERGADVERIRASILDRAARAPRPSKRSRWIIAAALVSVGAACVLLAAISPSRSPAPLDATSQSFVPVYHGTVHPRPGAHYHLSSATPDERVDLYDGTIEVEVAPLAAGERFRVVTKDGEVEVRGTLFEVAATTERLESVRVARGRVEVRSGQKSVVLGRGEEWTADDPKPSAPAPRRAPSPKIDRPAKVVAPVEKAAPPPVPAAPMVMRSPAEVAFDEGFAALRGSDFAAAASSFARAISADPDGALAEDSRYWRGVAFARAHDSEHAKAALTELLERHPLSVRRSEATVMLGWILFELGDLDGAAKRFDDAKDDVLPRARESARSGLEAVAKKRAR